MGRIKDKLSTLLEFHNILRDMFLLISCREHCTINGVQIDNPGRLYQIVNSTYTTASESTAIYFYTHINGYKYSYCYESCQFRIWRKNIQSWCDRRQIRYNKTKLLQRLDEMVNFMICLSYPISITFYKQ